MSGYLSGARGRSVSSDYRGEFPYIITEQSGSHLEIVRAQPV